MSCAIGHRHSLDPVLPWHRLAAVAPIQPLSWDLPYAVGVALQRKKKISFMCTYFFFQEYFKELIGEFYRDSKSHFNRLV